MDLSVLFIIAALFSILANATKVWEVISKVWAWVCSLSLLLNKKKITVFNNVKQMIDTNEAPEESPTPPVPLCINVFDTVRVGADVTVQLTGRTIRASGGRLLLG